MEQKSKTYIKKKVKRGKNKEISSYELLLRNSHELLWRKLSEYTLLSLGVVRLKVWLPDLKLASSIKLERGASVDSAISYIARKKKITNPHCGLYLDRHGECGIWLENNTPLWLYDIQASDVLEFKTRPAHNTTTLVIRVFIVEQKVFKSVAVDKLRKVSELVSSFQTQFGLIKGDLSYYGFNLLTPEANEIWLEDSSTLSSYLVHNMSVVEYKRKPIIVLEPVTPHPSIQNSCVLLQSVSVLEATTTIGKWLMPEIDPKEFEEQGLFYMQQNWWMEKDTPIGVYPFKQNDVISVGLIASDNAESLASKDVSARVVFAAPARKNLVKNQKISSLPGEVPVFKVSNVLHLSNFTSYVPATLSGGVVGDITISNYRLTFCALQSPEVSIEIPVASIARVEKGKNKNEIFHGYFLDILCKDNRLVRFYWPQHDDSRKKLCQTLKQLAFPGDQLKLFAFYYDEEFVVDGWSIYNFEAEYERQGILSPKMWRISHMNANYRMCETYPPLLAVPCKISDEQLREVFQFRSKGRIPVMTWQHPTNGTSISRCSQPLSGIRVTRCTEDEALIKHLGYSARSLVVDKLEKDLYVLDCRPKANALGNRAKGAGYEDTTTSYPNCILEFLDIGNIHVMRESYEKLLDICLTAVGGAPGGGWSGSGPSGWLLAVESTKWLDHICTILKAAERVVDCIHNQEISVLLHCSDGWDRTAQVGSLALILLDPYHRTTRGFALLIEKEWLAFGHKFAQRNGHGDSKHMDERSPVFLQFLDCVWQIMQQFPYAFEFNESFLIAIITHLHSCRFGTFLFNCHRDRSINYVREKTRSLWSMLLSPPCVHEYANVFYEPQDGVLQPNISPRYIQVWTRAHLSWYCAIPPSVDTKLRQHAQNQARTIDKLTRQIEELKCQIDPSRVTSASLPKTISSELKYSDSPIRIIVKNHIARTTLNSRADSGNLHFNGSSILQNSDSGFLTQNIQLSASLSSDINRLTYSGSESSIASELSFNKSSLLRGDSPFQRFREDSSYSSEDDNSDDEDPYSTNYSITHMSMSNDDTESSKNTTSGQQKTTRSPSANSRRQLEIPISSFSSSSVSVSSSALHLRVPSNPTSHKKSASSSHIPYSPPSSPKIIPRSPKLLPFSDMEEPSSPSLSNSGGYPRAKGDSKFSPNCLSHGNVEPSNSTSSSPTEEEPRWLRRSPSSKSLNFLDHRRLPPTINPNRFSST